MRKIAKIMLISLTLVLLISSLGVAAEESTLDKILDRGKLIVGTAPGYFPFEMIDDQGDVMGFDIDIAKAIAEKLDVELEVKNFQWAGVIPAIQSRKVDMIIAGMTITPERALKVTFSESYFDTGLAMLVNKENSEVESWSDLDKDSMKIGVCLGQTSDFYAEQFFENAEIRKYQGSERLAMAVTSGKVDAGIHDEPWVLIYAKKNPKNIFALTESRAKQSLGFALPKNDLVFKTWLDSFLTYYRQTPEYQQAYNYWFVDMPWLETK